MDKTTLCFSLWSGNMQMFWNDFPIQCHEVFALIHYITSQIVFPTKQVKIFVQRIILYYTETDFSVSSSPVFGVTHNEPGTILGMGSRGPGEVRGKLMWPATVPFPHLGALWTPHLIYRRLSLPGLLAMALLNPSIRTTLIGQRQNLPGNLFIGLDTCDLPAAGTADRGDGLHSLLGSTSDTVPVAWHGCPKPLIYIPIDYCAKKSHKCSYRPILCLR